MELYNKSAEFDSRSVMESARTILLCVNHQTRIIEDILTVSKLDATLLTVTPTEVQIHDLIAKTLSIFDDEVKRKDIALHFEVCGVSLACLLITNCCPRKIKESYVQNKTNWVFADPSRVTQVLVRHCICKSFRANLTLISAIQ